MQESKVQYELPSPPGAWQPALRLARFARRPLEGFLRVEAASGIVLLLAAAVAMLWANSPWAQAYVALWHTPLGVRLGEFQFERPLEWVVNDGLMVIFFFVVGLEIRREMHQGELSEWRRAALPAAAALGGMLAPAIIYLGLAGRGVTHSGWGVPMATDIAFAVGVLTLLGNRVPAALRVLLLALAVIDDLGAILVIALFYSGGVAASGLIVAAAGIVGVFVLQSFGVRQKLAYVLPGLVIWAGTYASGIHPTIAGVVIGFITPVRAWLGAEGFMQGVRGELESWERTDRDGLGADDLSRSLDHLKFARREALSPSESLIHSLHPWVAFAIMPLFALANAGVALDGLALDPSSTQAALGVGAGLVLGKPLGVLAASALMLRSGLATLPRGLTARHLLVLGVVAGIGFTMALFVAQLAFGDVRLLAAAKLGVLVASAVAGLLGLGLGRALLAPCTHVGIAQSADEAERSTEA